MSFQFRHIVLGMLFLASFARAQVTTNLLYSKMDFFAQHELYDGNVIRLMGYTELIGTPIDLPSPVLIYNEGDSVDLGMHNFSQAAHHTIHLHGLDVDQATDGVPHLSFSIPHDSVGHYQFIAPHAGTYLYHCHVVSTLHVQAGMYGLLIVRPPDGGNTTWDGGYAFDSENAWLFSEIDTNWHQNDIINDPYVPGSTVEILDYVPQYFMINGKTETQLSNPETSIEGSVNDAIYMRLANIGNYGNRVIFPASLNAQLIDSDGRPLPSAINTDTVELYPGERYGVLLSPDTEFTGNVDVEYINMNTQLVESTQEAPVTISGFNTINQWEVEQEMIVYPNPTQNDLNVVFNGLKDYNGTLKIMDVNGKTVLVNNENLNENSTLSLNTASLDKGVYFIQYLSSYDNLLKKFVRQ